jgi:hypothetical protein
VTRPLGASGEGVTALARELTGGVRVESRRTGHDTYVVTIVPPGGLGVALALTGDDRIALGEILAAMPLLSID